MSGLARWGAWGFRLSQRIDLDLAQKHLKGRDKRTDWILREWDYALSGLEMDPMLLDDRVDWVAKRKLLEMFRQAEGVDWQDDVMQSLDLEYHNINPDRSLYHGLLDNGQLIRLLDDGAIDTAMTQHPQNTRASGRAAVIRRLLESETRRYVVDWDGVYLDRDRHLDLRNPFHP